MGKFLSVFDKNTHIQRTWYSFFPANMQLRTLWFLDVDIRTHPTIIEIESMIQGEFFWDFRCGLSFDNQADRDMMRLIYG